MEKLFIGRKLEKRILLEALESPDAELVAVIGRRRVGKTYLVRSVYERQIKFEIAGIQGGSLQEQLQFFAQRLNFHVKPTILYPTPANWLEAFNMLIMYFENQDLSEKIVCFFDEFPWLNTRKSGFLNAFGAFWNSWASQKNIVIVICGSAASWMIQKVVRNKGGLHNRITRNIQLSPFNLCETQAYLKARHIKLDPYQTAQLYMALGGIPHYLKEIRAGLSAAQNIDRIFFSPSSFMREEFEALYPALFDNADRHIQLIRKLAEKWKGMTRQELIESTKLSNGGSATKALEELVHSGFVIPYYTFGKKKKALQYRLMDEYSIFYLKFIENKRTEGIGTWERLSQTQGYKIWTGFAFENLCMRHTPQIKTSLGISGIYSETSTFYQRGTDEQAGVQIDLLIDRNDHVINLMEMKFYNTDFNISKAYATELRKKMERFKTATKTKKQLFWVLVTTFGLEKNEHSLGLVDRVINLDKLFIDEESRL